MQSSGKVQRFVEAILIKRRTSDGLVEFWEDVELGRKYKVNLNSIVKDCEIMNTQKNVLHRKDVIFTEEGEWLPLECLSLKVDA